MNDNIQYLNEFFDVAQNKFYITPFGKDTFVLSDHEELLETMSYTALFNGFNNEGCYVQFNNKIIDKINVVDVSEGSAFGIFVKSFNYETTKNIPYNACILSNNQDFLMKATLLLIDHHKFSFGFHALQDIPHLPVAPQKALNIRATTLCGDTKMKNRYFRTYASHEQAFDEIMESLFGSEPAM